MISDQQLRESLIAEDAITWAVETLRTCKIKDFQPLKETYLKFVASKYGLSHTVALSDEMKKGLHDFATNIWAACMQTLINNSDRKPALSLNLKKFHKDQDRVIDKMVSETLAALAAHPEQHREEGIKQLLEQQKEFSSKTFGEIPFTAPLHHLLKEIKEVLDESESGAALTEFADCFLLLLDAYWRRFPYWNTDQLVSAAFNKLEVNKKRKWGKSDANGTFQHLQDNKKLDV